MAAAGDRRGRNDAGFELDFFFIGQFKADTEQHELRYGLLKDDGATARA